MSALADFVLNSGGDHEIFRLVTERGAFALRLPHQRPDPSTWTTRLAGALLGEASAIGPCLRAIDPASGVMIVDWIDGTTVRTQKSQSKYALARSLGSILKRLHASAPPMMLQHVSLATLAHSLPVAPIFQQIAHRLAQTQEEHCPSHGDLVPHNIIIEPGGQFRLIDWDYAGMHDPCWDLAYVIQEIGLNAQEADALLMAYGRRPRPERILLFRAVIVAVNAAWRQARNPIPAHHDAKLAAIFAAHPAIHEALKTLSGGQA